MPYCYYTCNLLPTSFLAKAGYQPRWLGAHALIKETAGRFDSANVHPMTCPFVTRLVTAAERVLADGSAADRMVVPGGCDAMRRAGDLLASQYPNQVWTLRLPRCADEGALVELEQELKRAHRWLRDSAGEPPETPRPSAPETESLDVRRGLDLPSEPRPGGVFLVGGPLSDASLLEFITRLGPPISGVESCTAPARWRALDGPQCFGDGPDSYFDAERRGGAQPEETPPEEGRFEKTARLILAHGVCPRRSSADRRVYLAERLRAAQPACVIYARQSFCDPGAYDSLLVAELAAEQGLPFLEVEVGFPLEVSGPLRTRVEAFLEAQLLDDDLLGESNRRDRPGGLEEFDELDDLLDDWPPSDSPLGDGPPRDGLPSRGLSSEGLPGNNLGDDHPLVNDLSAENHGREEG